MPVQSRARMRWRPTNALNSSPGVVRKLGTRRHRVAVVLLRLSHQSCNLCAAGGFAQVRQAGEPRDASQAGCRQGGAQGRGPRRQARQSAAEYSPAVRFAAAGPAAGPAAASAAALKPSGLSLGTQILGRQGDSHETIPTLGSH